MTLDKLFLALHVLGDFVWVGGLFTVLALLEVHAALPDAAARAKMQRHVKIAAMVPDIGATLAMLFGLHWLVRFKLYEVPYMHAKLSLVFLLIVAHVVIRRRASKAYKTNEPAAIHPGIKGLLMLIVLGILIFVLSKWPL